MVTLPSNIQKNPSLRGNESERGNLPNHISNPAPLRIEQPKGSMKT